MKKNKQSKCLHGLTINVDGFNDFEILQNEKGVLSKAKDLLEKQRVFSLEKIKAHIIGGDETNAKKTNEAIRPFKMITATILKRFGFKSKQA